MQFDPAAYGESVARILALDGGGERLMPLAGGRCSSEAARTELARCRLSELLPGAPEPEAALAGLWLYFSCLEEAHAVAQKLHTPEGSFWHGILHRQEPDAANAAYWFRRTGRHPIFPQLLEEAAAAAARYPEAGVNFGDSWDPFGFIELCEEARRDPGSPLERVALEVQRAEWQLLFDYCARPRR
ncbi:MAG TPA: hypothetical protein VNJ11_09945 [Bryobacteraceae bacterium]|nr:hypothetical protein [Bryobacteraceae bacterium]